MPGRGSGSAKRSATKARLMTTRQRSIASPSGALITMASVSSAPALQRSGVSTPSPSRHSTSGKAEPGSGAPVKKLSERKSRVLATRGKQPAGEGRQARVGARPVDRGDRVVLRIGVVVAVLAEAQLRSHRQHRRAAGDREQREKIALVAAARRKDRGIVRRPFDAVVPGMVVARAVAVLLAVRLVVLGDVGDEVGEREAVVGDDEVDGLAGVCAPC